MLKCFSSKIFVRDMMILHIDIESIERKVNNRYTNLRGKLKVFLFTEDILHMEKPTFFLNNSILLKKFSKIAKYKT